MRSTISGTGAADDDEPLRGSAFAAVRCLRAWFAQPGAVRLAPFTHRSRIDASELVHTTRTAVRMLDDVIDVSTFPLPEQRIETLATRRIGLGVMGLADAFVMLGIRYDSAEAREWLESVLRSSATPPTRLRSTWRRSAAHSRPSA